jgi:hypothetical protein
MISEFKYESKRSYTLMIIYVFVFLLTLKPNTTKGLHVELTEIHFQYVVKIRLLVSKITIK